MYVKTHLINVLSKVDRARLARPSLAGWEHNVRLSARQSVRLRRVFRDSLERTHCVVGELPRSPGTVEGIAELVLSNEADDRTVCRTLYDRETLKIGALHKLADLLQRNTGAGHDDDILAHNVGD
jgi:hypothetical protein